MKRLLTCALIALSSIAFGATTVPVQLISPAGSASGQVITSAGATSPPAWGAMGYNALPVQIPNSLIGNVSSSTQAPNVVGLPSCASNTNALIYTNGAGFTCNTNINASTLGGQIFAAPGPIGSSVASTGSFTTLGASGLISPTSTIGIKGTSTNDNAQAGSIGEFVSSTATNVSVATTTPINITSISLPAGDWDVTGQIQSVPNAATVTQALLTGISLTSNTISFVSGSFANQQLIFTSATAGAANALIAPTTRISIAATTTVYLIGQANFTTNTMAISGYIRARRVR